MFGWYDPIMIDTAGQASASYAVLWTAKPMHLAVQNHGRTAGCPADPAHNVELPVMWRSDCKSLN